MVKYTIKYRCATCNQPQAEQIAPDEVIFVKSFSQSPIHAVVACPACGTEQKVPIPREEYQAWIGRRG